MIVTKFYFSISVEKPIDQTNKSLVFIDGISRSNGQWGKFFDESNFNHKPLEQK